MVVKTFGERTGAVLNRGMQMDPLAKGMHLCGQDIASKSLPEINTERLGLPEAGEMRQSRRGRG